MNSSEMCGTLLNGGNGETAKLAGNKGELLAAMRYFKREKIPLKGGIEIEVEGCKGKNIRKAELSDPVSMFGVFDKFTTKYHEKCRKPVCDKEHNGLVASDGRMMLACRIPRDFPVDKVEGCGFSPVQTFPWTWFVDEMEVTDYTLLAYTRLATVEKGGYIHGYVQTVAEAARAYWHYGEDGEERHLWLRIGDEFYNPSFAANIVDSLFKLGCGSVEVCRKTDGGFSPLHFFGVGGEVAAKGLLMPMRYGDLSLGSFVMPKGGENGKKVA